MVCRHIVNQRALGRRVECAEQTHGNVVQFRRLHTCGVQNLGTEISKLGSLLKIQAFHWTRVFNIARVIVVHTVNVGPDFNLLRADSSANERRRIVAAAALQVVCLAISVFADVALRDIYFGIPMLVEHLRQASL